MVKKVLVFSSLTNSEKVAKDKANLEFDDDLKKVVLKCSVDDAYFFCLLANAFKAFLRSSL